MKLQLPNSSYEVWLFGDRAGLLSVELVKQPDKTRFFGLHMLPKKGHIMWGRHEETYEGDIHLFGAGPLFLCVWSYG